MRSSMARRLACRLQHSGSRLTAASMLLFADLAAGEESSAETDTTHVETVHLLRFAGAAKDQPGAAAADIDHQPAPVAAFHGTGHARVDQARLLYAGDDIDRMTQGLFRLTDELGCIIGGAKGVGSHGTHAA